MYTAIDMSQFPPEREEKLKSIYRFSMFEVNYYRSNLWQHSHRVNWIVEELIPHLQKFVVFDPEKVRAMALVHDDAEMLTGDIQAGHKARMTKEELKKIDEDELLAIGKLSRLYPEKFHGYLYKILLEEMVHKKTSESQIVSLADKLDAHCETYHEVMAGNVMLIASAAFYINTMQRFGEKFPVLQEFLESKAHPLVEEYGTLPPNGKIGLKEYALFGKPHTKESLEKSSFLPFYDAWRKLVASRGGEEGVRWLTEQHEYNETK